MTDFFLVASFFFPLKYIARSLTESAGSELLGHLRRDKKVGKNYNRE